MFSNIRKKLGHFDPKPDSNDFPEITSSGNLTTQIAVWVNAGIDPDRVVLQGQKGPKLASFFQTFLVFTFLLDEKK